jgi:hypothetical protein
MISSTIILTTVPTILVKIKHDSDILTAVLVSQFTQGNAVNASHLSYGTID